MIAYTVIGSNNKEKALEFYDAIFEVMGVGRVFNNDRLQFYGDGKGAMLGVGTPANGEPATVGNGVMPSIGAADKETVDKVYQKVIEMGGQGEEAPADGIPGFYGGYFRDLDGNRLCICKLG